MLHSELKLKNIDDLLRGGHFVEAKKQLSSIKISRTTPIEVRTECASLWRRLGEPIRGLKVLGSIEKFNSKLAPTERKRWIEYADCLLQINALGGVSRVLAQTQLQDERRYNLIEAFYSMHSWNYEKSLLALSRYLQKEDPESYFFAVGKINKIACLAFLEKSEEAIAEAEKILPQLQGRGYLRLIANCSEILMQISMQMISKSSGKRITALMKKFSPQIESDPQVLENNYIKKWQAYLALRNNEAGAIKNLENLRESSHAKGFSEIVRDIDRVFAEKNKDHSLKNFIYFGTPYSAFLAHFGINKTADEIQIFIEKNNGEIQFREPEFTSSSHSPLSFDLSEFLEAQKFSLPAKLLAALFRDFYRPPTTVELFDTLYPSEYFHPISSLRKINQLVFRLNQMLIEKKYPFQVLLLGRGYRLICKKNLKIRLAEPPWQIINSTESEFIRRRMETSLPKEFTLQQAIQVLGEKRRTAQNILHYLVEEKQIFREGRTSKVIYRFLPITK